MERFEHDQEINSVKGSREVKENKGGIEAHRLGKGSFSKVHGVEHRLERLKSGAGEERNQDNLSGQQHPLGV